MRQLHERARTCMQAVHGKDVLVHWEDFGSRNAAALLERYRGRGPTFNDDIQSTAAVTLACVLGACRRDTVPPLADQVFVFAGAGQAALGTAALLTTALMDEVRSLPPGWLKGHGFSTALSVSGVYFWFAECLVRRNPPSPPIHGCTDLFGRTLPGVCVFLGGLDHRGF